MPVYFVQAQNGGPIKIGYAKDAIQVKARRGALQCGNPELLIVRRVIPGDRDVEREQHSEWNHLRVRGEWFHAHFDLASFAHAIPAETPFPQ